MNKVCQVENRPVVGAIRWDAWTGGDVTQQVERTLGPLKYRDRLPWFAEIGSHLSNALAFVRKHPDLCTAQAIIL